MGCRWLLCPRSTQNESLFGELRDMTGVAHTPLVAVAIALLCIALEYCHLRVRADLTARVRVRAFSLDRIDPRRQWGAAGVGG